jgi:adenine phosphoribosyltransferase
LDFIRTLIREVPDFPAPGILFRDVTPLLADAGAFREVVRHLAAPVRELGVDVVAGVESRGFIFGAPLAIELGASFVPVRKAGKLPATTIQREYSLEYGSSHLEMPQDALRPGQRVLLVDDLLATGGTARAAAEMIRELGGDLVALSFVIELTDLEGRAHLPGLTVSSLLKY